MSLDKAIKHGKEHRKPYYKSGRFDLTCRPNGGCPYCEGNRMHRDRLKEEDAEGQVREYWRGEGVREGKMGEG